jgi:hypothetical protein
MRRSYSATGAGASPTLSTPHAVADSSTSLERWKLDSVMYWLLLKLTLLTFVPLPVRPKLTRPDPAKNLWTFECDRWISPYHLAVMYYIDYKSA